MYARIAAVDEDMDLAGGALVRRRGEALVAAWLRKRTLPSLRGDGEAATADYRSAEPTVDELRRLAAESRLGGVLVNKAVTMLVYVVDGASRLELMRDALAKGVSCVSVFVRLTSA